MDFTTLIGLVAAFCTTVSYYPQLKKCWETGSGWGSLAEDVPYTANWCGALGGVWPFEKRSRDHHRVRGEVGSGRELELLVASC